MPTHTGQLIQAQPFGG